MSLLELRGAGFAYGSHRVLDDISLCLLYTSDAADE